MQPQAPPYVGRSAAGHFPRAGHFKETAVGDNAPAIPTSLPLGPLAHGGRVLPAVTVDTYNEELREEDGFVGDRASRRAFRAILADWRALTESCDDPLGDTPTEEVSRLLDKMMASDDPVRRRWSIPWSRSPARSRPVRCFLRCRRGRTPAHCAGRRSDGRRIGELAMGQPPSCQERSDIELRRSPTIPTSRPDRRHQLAPSWTGRPRRYPCRRYRRH
jgi:hypothetical protein